MAASQSDGALVERMIKRRRLILIALAIGYAIWQIGFITRALGIGIPAPVEQAIDIASAIGFVSWLAALVLLFVTSGAIARNAAVRQALEDELTQANRSAAFISGFWAVLAATATLYALALFLPLTAKQVMPIIIAIGVTVPVMRFIALDRRGESDG